MHRHYHTAQAEIEHFVNPDDARHCSLPLSCICLHTAHVCSIAVLPATSHVPFQAEIEHFVNPDDKRHPKFGNIAELQPLLYSRAMQMGM